MGEARTHVFNGERWGHSQYLSKTSDFDKEGNPTYSGLVISTPVVREGDFIEWGTEYGTARLLVERTTYVRDPDDMVRVDRARIVERRTCLGAVVWTAEVSA